MTVLRGDINCLHCLGVGTFGGVLFGGQKECFCVQPLPCSRCEGNGKEPYNRSGKLYCFTCNGSGLEPRSPPQTPKKASVSHSKASKLLRDWQGVPYLTQTEKALKALGFQTEKKLAEKD